MFNVEWTLLLGVFIGLIHMLVSVHQALWSRSIRKRSLLVCAQFNWITKLHIIQNGCNFFILVGLKISNSNANYNSLLLSSALCNARFHSTSTMHRWAKQGLVHKCCKLIEILSMYFCHWDKTFMYWKKKIQQGNVIFWHLFRLTFFCSSANTSLAWTHDFLLWNVFSEKDTIPIIFYMLYATILC